MALKYTCDQCGEESGPNETYGTGVFTEDGKGRHRSFKTESGLVINVLPLLEGSDQQICGACTGRGVREMVEELWPNNYFTGLPERSNHAEDDAGGDRAGRHLQRVRTGEPLPEPGADVEPARCPHCRYALVGLPAAFCSRPELHSAGGGPRTD